MNVYIIALLKVICKILINHIKLTDNEKEDINILLNDINKSL